MSNQLGDLPNDLATTGIGIGCIRAIQDIDYVNTRLQEASFRQPGRSMLTETFSTEALGPTQHKRSKESR